MFIETGWYPSRWNKLSQCWLLANDRKARPLVNLSPFGPAFRFSARFGGAGRGSQLCQQFVEPATHLLQGHRTVLALPGTQLRFDQRASQHQMVMSNRHQVTPPFKLLRGAQTWFFPQERLLIEAIAMLLAKAQSVSLGNLSDIGLRVPDPDKP